jgi:hypothetical protein
MEGNQSSLQRIIMVFCWEGKQDFIQNTCTNDLDYLYATNCVHKFQFHYTHIFVEHLPHFRQALKKTLEQDILDWDNGHVSVRTDMERM